MGHGSVFVLVSGSFSFDFLDTRKGWIRHLISREHSKSPPEGLPKDWIRPPGRPRHNTTMHPGSRSPTS